MILFNLFSDLRRGEEGLLPESHKKRNIVAVNRLLLYVSQFELIINKKAI